MQIAAVLFPRLTALDVVGPYEVLQRLPGASVTFVGHRTGEVRTENGFLGLTIDATFDEVSAPDVVVVPGGIGTVEASTAALLIGAGATAGAAAVAVALFRLFDLWLPVITGAAVARRDARCERRLSAGERATSTSTIELARIEHWAGASTHL